MSEVRIVAEPRTEFGKGGARRTRRAGNVPAVLYGHGQPPRHISLPARDLLHALKTDAGSNVLLTVVVNGSSQLALPKEIQRHPVRGTYEHVDLVVVRHGEKVTVDIPVILTGEAGMDVLVDQQSQTVTVLADASHIPNSIEVDLAGLAIGQGIRAGALELPSGSELVTDPDHVIVQGLGAQAAEEPETTEEGADAAADSGDDAERAGAATVGAGAGQG